MTPARDLCSECRRPLLWSSGVLMCCFHHCPEFGRSVEDNQPADKATHKADKR